MKTTAHTTDAFIEFLLDYHILKFGEYQLKSGRVSPYFFNAGLFQDGPALKILGEYYAALYQTHQLTTRHLFGPAYKGIALTTATAIALAAREQSLTVTFNRKEAKTHGEGGVLIGAPLTGPTTIVDDVITAGTAIRESIALIKANGGTVDSVLIALDRCERGQHETATITEIQALGIRVYAIVTLFDIIDYLNRHQQTEQARCLVAYQKQYAPSV